MLWSTLELLAHHAVRRSRSQCRNWPETEQQRTLHAEEREPYFYCVFTLAAAFLSAKPRRTDEGEKGRRGEGRRRGQGTTAKGREGHQTQTKRRKQKDGTTNTNHNKKGTDNNNNNNNNSNNNNNKRTKPQAMTVRAVIVNTSYVTAT